MDQVILSLSCVYLTSLSNDVIPIDLPSFSLAILSKSSCTSTSLKLGKSMLFSNRYLYISNNVEVPNLSFRAVSGPYFIALFLYYSSRLKKYIFVLLSHARYSSKKPLPLISLLVCVTMPENKFCLIIQASSHSVRVLYLFLVYCFHYLFI